MAIAGSEEQAERSGSKGARRGASNDHVRGEDAVVVMDAEGFGEYESARRPKEPFYEFMQCWADRMKDIGFDIPPRSVPAAITARWALGT